MSSMPFDAKSTAERIKKPLQELFMDTMNFDLSTIENVTQNEILKVIFYFREQVTPENLEVISAAKAIMDDVVKNGNFEPGSELTKEISSHYFWFLHEIFYLVK